jgi:geranylgeranyl reductase family protein
MAENFCFDVAVVGAGPAGGAAALALAQAGREVVLLEKAPLPRYKTCGGGVLARALKLLPPSVEGIVERRFNSVALNFLGTQRNFVASREQPLVYMTMRAELDNLLARAAEKAGARLVDACKVNGMAPENGWVKLASDRGDFRARFVIAADGVHSPTARAAGWPELPVLAPALEHEIHLPAGEFARFSELPRFDFNVIDGGYAWVFPKRSHLSAGILSTRRICPDLQARFSDYLRRLGLPAAAKTERHGYVIPLAPRPGPLARERVLLAGDAAGLVDPVTAEGISYAILSGQLAAAAVTDGRLDVAKVAPIYQRLLEANILGELRAGRFLAKILYRHPRIRDGVFRLDGQRLCDFAARVILGEEGYLQALKRPANYFKLLGL